MSNAVSSPLQSSCKSVIVPRSIPGLVTQRMLVMEFLDGTQITRLGNKMHGAALHLMQFSSQQTDMHVKATVQFTTDKWYTSLCNHAGTRRRVQVCQRQSGQSPSA